MGLGYSHLQAFFTWPSCTQSTQAGLVYKTAWWGRQYMALFDRIRLQTLAYWVLLCHHTRALSSNLIGGKASMWLRNADTEKNDVHCWPEAHAMITGPWETTQLSLWRLHMLDIPGPPWSHSFWPKEYLALFPESPPCTTEHGDSQKEKWHVHSHGCSCL